MGMTQPDEDNDSKWVWPHPADLGTVLIAGVFLAGMIGTIVWMFSSPEPVKDLFAKKPANTGEVTITLPPKN